MSEKDGYAIAMSVDPNTSDDVCTFCIHAGSWDIKIFPPKPPCKLGHDQFFRSLSDMGPIWVSDCGAGELRPELVAIDKNKR